MSEIQEIQNVLVIEDEPKLARLIVEYLEANNFKAIWLNNGSEAVNNIIHHNIGLVILDIMLPGKDGYSICQEIRSQHQIPIIILTALTQEDDRINGFEVGADDYICKPFSPKELIYRVKAILKRTTHTTEKTIADAPLLSINTSERIVKVSGIPLDLTPVEFGILTALTQSPGRIFSRNELLNKVYSDSHVISDRTIDSHIKNLRRKLHLASPKHNIIQSVYGLGYKSKLPG